MQRLRVHNFTISLDGYVAGPDQSFDNPLGVGGRDLHQWAFAVMNAGPDSDVSPVDRRFMEQREIGAGATIMGRNMFGPIRGDWGDDRWTGWWGDDPPYHHPVFVLTNHPHDPIPMAGGTTFHFVTDGIESALEQARAAAGDRDVAIAGGASTVRQYLAAGLLDELNLHIAPVVLGGGERLLEDVGDPALELVEVSGTPGAAHVRCRVIR